MKKKHILPMAFLYLNSALSIASPPEKVPDYLDQTRMVYMQDMFTPELGKYISLIKKVEGEHVVLSKRLGDVHVGDDVRLEPDDSTIVDAFVSCKAKGKAKLGDFLMIYLTEKPGHIQARYPTSYECDFNHQAFERAIISKYNEDKKIFDMNNGRLCDGKNLRTLVAVASAYGQGILNIAKDPRWGGHSVSLALHSENVPGFYQGLVNIRQYDLGLKDSGCESLSDGPTDAEISRLNNIRMEVNGLAAAESNKHGFVSHGGY